MTTIRNDLPTLRTAGAALLSADDTMHSAMQSAACSIMLAVEEGKVALPTGFDWAAYLKDATTNEAKAFNTNIREAVKAAFADHVEKGGRTTDKEAEFSKKLATITSKMLNAARDAAALKIMGATPRDYLTIGKTAKRAFHVAASNMVPRDKAGKPLAGSFIRPDASFPIDNGARVFTDGEKLHSIKLTLATVRANAAVIAGKVKKSRTKSEAAQHGAEALAESPIGLAAMLSQGAAKLVMEDGTPAKVLRENSEVNAECATLLVSLMAAFGIMMVPNDNPEGVASFNVKRALEVYEATRDGNPVDLIAH